MKVLLITMLLSFSLAAGYVMFVQNDHDDSYSYSEQENDNLELHWTLV